MPIEEHFSGLSCQLLTYCREGFLCDTIIIAGGRSVKVHGILLAAASPRLKQLLDTQPGDDMRFLILSDINYDQLCVAIYFIYTGNIVLPSNKDEEYYDVLKSSLLNLGLCSKSINNSDVFYESNGELDFSSYPCSKILSDIDSDLDDSDPEDEKSNLDTLLSRARQLRDDNGSDEKSSSVSIKSKNRSVNVKSRNRSVNIKSKNHSIKSKSRNGSVNKKSKNIAISYKSKSRSAKNKSRRIVDESDYDDDTVDEDYEVDQSDDRKYSPEESASEDARKPPVAKYKKNGISDKETRELCDEVDQVLKQQKLKNKKTTKKRVIEDRDQDEEPLENSAVKSENLDAPENDESNDPAESSETGTLPEKKFKCQKCPKVFATQDNLMRHGISHTLGSMARFKMLPKRKSDASRLEPASIPDSAKKYECQICNKKFLLARNLQTHQITHMEATGRPFTCPTCGKVLETKAALMSHMRSHNPSQAMSMLCHICGKEFKSRSNMRKHMAKPHVSYKCEKCDGTFNTKLSLFQHSLVEHGVHVSIRTKIDHPPITEATNTHLCYICGHGFSSQKSYLTHRLIHRRNCSVCNKVCEGDAELQEHMSKEHPGEEVRPANWCSICERGFKLKRTLKDHMLQHSETRPFLCKTCGESFASVSRLSYHIQTNHIGPEKPRTKKRRVVTRPYRERLPIPSGVTRIDGRTFRCNECGVVLKNHGTMHSHMAHHAGELPHGCSVCDKKFISAYSLVRHMSIHTGELPYTCSECGKRFRQHSHLTRHMHKHSGTKPYMCEMCDKGYSSSLDLRNHYSRFHHLDITSTKITKYKSYSINIPTTSAADAAVSAPAPPAPAAVAVSDNSSTAMDLGMYSDRGMPSFERPNFERPTFDRPNFERPTYERMRHFM